MPCSRSKREDFTRREPSSISTAAIPPASSTASETGRLKETAQKEPCKLRYSLLVNSQEYQLAADPRAALLDMLREELGLTGTKKGCDHGQCGACTVHIDGRSVLSCLTLAVAAKGHAVTTIEGISEPYEKLHPMQQAFIDQDALQCGYCTPGQIMSAIACVNAGQAESPGAIREYMSGNLCRCAAYPNIIAAIAQAREQMREKPSTEN
jgi:xanthine dehydrogenase YagT iron-sulfur-binding subunit